MSGFRIKLKKGFASERVKHKGPVINEVFRICKL